MTGIATAYQKRLSLGTVYLYSLQLQTEIFFETRESEWL